MPLEDLLNRPCTITRRSESGTIDDYGNDIPDEETVETVCELQQRTRLTDGEPAGQGELSDTRWLLVLPAGTDIRTGDTVEVDGQVYEMFGDPWPARNPRTQEESHVECNLRRTAGTGDAS
jgi:hypothetical protein